MRWPLTFITSSMRPMNQIVAVGVAIAAVAGQDTCAGTSTSTFACSVRRRPRCRAVIPGQAASARRSLRRRAEPVARSHRRRRRRCRGTACVAEPGSSVVMPGSGVIMIAAGFGLPPRVARPAAVAADLLAVPDPRFGVDRFADGAQQPQRRQVVLGGYSVPHFMNVRIAVGAV